MTTTRIVAFSVAFLYAHSLAAQTAPQPPAAFQNAFPPAAAGPGQAAPQPNTQRPASQLAPPAPTPAEKFAIVRLKQATPVNGMTRTAADLSELKSEPRLKDFDLTRVQLEGAAIPSKTPLGTQVGIQWTAVSRTDTTDRRETLPKPWESKLNIAGANPTLPENQKVGARGDIDQMVTAISKLFAKGEPEKKEQQAQQKSSQQNAGTAAPTAAPAKMNDQAQLPQIQPVTKEEERPDTYASSTDGCPIRLDEANWVAIKQSQTVKNGEPQGDCADSGQQFPITKSYEQCTDLVEIEAKTAKPTYRRYYIDGDGTTRYIDAECKPDPETTYTIAEDKTVCGFQVNANDLKVTKLSKLVYMNRNNARVEVTGCQPSESEAPITATLDTTVCPIRHDLTGGQSYEQGKVTWTYDGKTETDGGCTDTGTKWAHFNDMENCPPVIDYDKMKVWKTSRTAYTRDGVKEYITAQCGIGQNDAADLQKSVAGCEGILIDNFPGQLTYATSRYYYDFGGGPKYITDCNLDETKSWPHQIRTVGWEHNDTLMTSRAKSDVYIVKDGVEVIRKSAVVLDDTPQTPYVFQSQSTQPDPTKPPTYDGCNKYTATALVDSYKRPDNTIYNHKVGPGASVGPTNICVSTLVDTQRLNTGTQWFKDVHDQACASAGDESSNYICTDVYYWANYYMQEDIQKHEIKNVDTGQVISTTCKFMHNSWNYYRGQRISTSGDSWSSSPPGGSGQTISLSPCPY